MSFKRFSFIFSFFANQFVAQRSDKTLEFLIGHVFEILNETRHDGHDSVFDLICNKQERLNSTNFCDKLIKIVPSHASNPF